jgi:AcrR family transcriptional regulator
VPNPTSEGGASTALTARRVGLDRDDVVDAALALVESEGAGALTMRRLAAELDVTTTTIYWHAGNRDELVLALITRLSDRLAERTVTGSTPAERVLSAATNIWDSARAHRHVTALAYQIGAASVLELPLEVALARDLEAAGLRGVAVRDALRAIVMCTAGFLVVALRARPTDGEAPAAVPPARELWSAADTTGLSSETVAALGRAPSLAALFESTMRALIAGLLPEGGRP